MEHPRHAELMDILRRSFTGTVAKNLKTVPIVFVGTDNNVKQEQKTNEAQVLHTAPIAAAVPTPSKLLKTPKTKVTKGQC